MAEENTSDRSINIGQSVSESIVVSGDRNWVTFNKTEIIQISPNEIKTRQLTITSPYKGLKRFEPKDKDLFFGRDQFLKELANELEQTNLILLLGASGSGKSSVVQAGLIPWLSREWGSQLTFLIFTPDLDPFESLYANLLSHYGQAKTQFIRRGRAETLIQTVEALKAKDACWLIFIDQFEELFTLCQDSDRRKALIDGLVQIATSTDQSVKIVLAMRADFLGEFSSYSRFSKIAQASTHLVNDLHPDELRLAIEQPAAQHGVVFESGLVEEIIKDVQGQPGSLPLLQYTLDLLWKTDDVTDRVLHTKTYRELGGVRGALQQHVDQIYDDISEDEKTAIKQIFLRLVSMVDSEEAGSAQKFVKKRAFQEDFEGDLVKRTLHKLVAQNLLVSNLESNDPQKPTVEIAHEILLSSWQLLKDWLEDNHQVIRIYQQLAEDAARWNLLLDQKNKPKANDELWSGARLEKALELRRDNIFQPVWGELSKPQNHFLNASQLWRDRRRQRTIVGLASFSAVALGLAGIAGWQWQTSEQRGQESLSRQIAAQADALKNQQPRLFNRSVLLAVEAMKRLPTVSLENTQFLQNAISLLPRQVAYLPHQKNVQAIAFSKSGKYLATASWDGTAAILDVSSGREIVRLKMEDNALIHSISFSPDEKLLATGGIGGTHLWNVATGQEVGHLKPSNVVLSLYPVTSLAFSLNGKYLVTASTSNAQNSYGRPAGVVQVWDAASGKEIVTYAQAGVKTIAFSPDGKYLATAGDHNAVQVWDAANWQEVVSLEHEGGVKAIAFSSDSQYLATGSEDKTARVWEIPSGRQVVRVRHRQAVNAVVFVPDKKRATYFFTGSDDKTARLWKISTGRELTRVEHKDAVISVAVHINPDNTGKFATSSQDGTARLWVNGEGDLESDFASVEVARIAHEAGVKAIAFSPDGHYLATASENQANLLTGDRGEAAIQGAWVWDVNSIQQTTAQLFHEKDVTAVGYSPDGKYLATASGNQMAAVDPRRAPEAGFGRLWDAASGKLVATLKHDNWVPYIALSEDGKYFATASLDKSVRVFDIANNKEITHLEQDYKVLAVEFSPDNRYLVIAGGPFGYFFAKDGKPVREEGDGVAQVWDVTNQRFIQEVFKHENHAIYSAIFSPDSKLLATASEDKTVRVWDITSGKEIYRLQHDYPVYSVTFSRDGKYLATADGEGADPLTQKPGTGNVRLWDAHTGREVKPLAPGGAGISAVFSPNGRYLAAATGANIATVWEVPGGQVIQRLPHGGNVWAVQFSPDNRYLATGSGDENAHIWDIFSGQEVTRSRHETVVQSVAFSPDGKQLASGSLDNTTRTLRFWRREDLINETCSRLTRNFTLQEWTQYLGNQPYQKTCPNLP